MTKKRVAIVGAGWAGLATAVELVDRGFHVEVFEASRTLGGRARSLEWNGTTIDNGQHILIGAYSETLRLMQKVGIDLDTALTRIPLTLWYPGEFRMVAPRLPAPFHTAFALACAQGIDWREKWAAIRLMTSLKRARYRIEPDITVTEWLNQHKTPSRQRRLLWEPLCISALNTPAERASAQIMANVLRDSLGGSREASDMLIPRKPLSEIFPDPAARYIEQQGGIVRQGHRVSELRKENGHWTIDGYSGFDKVVLAVAPYHLAPLSPTAGRIAECISYEPIVTSYFQYAPDIELRAPMIGIDGGTSQWLFDRGHLCAQPGMIAAVISARGRHQSMSAGALEQGVATEISPHLRVTGSPIAARTITEQRATFSCVPGLKRLDCRPEVEGPWLAGDHVANDYPGTIEGAVRTGIKCAQSIPEQC